MHLEGPPKYGSCPCARRGSRTKGKEFVYCRYGFPKVLLDWKKIASVTDDEHRPNLRNLQLTRNDPWINSFEEHILLANMGNIDWRPS